MDDVRSFPDARPWRVARTSGRVVELLQALQAEHIDHWWLDHDRARHDTVWPVVRVLERPHPAGQPFDIGVTHVHASRSGAAHQMLVHLRRTGYTAVSPNGSGVWTW